jgi:stage II sporulation protein GA (sporulation sigma-E factor processing peptidase)
MVYNGNHKGGMRLRDQAVLEVYVDVVLGLNLILDGLALWAAGRLFHVKINGWRVFGGALLGAGYALWVYMYVWDWADSMIMKIAASILMIWIAYGYRPLMLMCRLILGFYLVSFAMGGAVMALTARRAGIWLLIGISAVCAGITALIGQWLERQRMRQRLIYRCRLREADRTWEFLGFLDTGNRLKDPLTMRPVVILERKTFEAWIWPREIWENRRRPVPFQTIDNETRVLMGFEPEGFQIRADGQWQEIRPIVIALSDKVLDRKHRYQGLLPLEILNEMGGFHDAMDKESEGMDQLGACEIRSAG